MDSVSRALQKLKLSKSAPLPYQPLEAAQDIRLLERVPDGKGLTYRLKLFDLGDIQSDELVYDALSYTWGPPLFGDQCAEDYGPKHDRKVGIIIRDTRHELRICRNLYEALEHIDSLLPIWIDAICINQADLEEKSRQILLMGEIYSKAARVLAWLGPEDGNAQHLVWLSEEAYVEVTKQFEAEYIPRHLFSVGQDGGVVIIGQPNIIFPRNALNALYGLSAKRRYFTRAWVRQELILARAPYLVIGKTLVGFNTLAKVDLLLNDLGGLVELYRPVDALGNHMIGASVSQYLTITRQMRGWASKMRPDMEKGYGAQDDMSAVLAFLVDYLMRSERLTASDPRDLLYSALGVVGKLDPTQVLRPDYTLSTAEVFTAFTSLVLSKLPSRSMLAMVSIKRPHADYVLQLPSWVPDLATSWICSPAVQQIMTLTGELVQQERMQPPMRIEGRRLSLRARRCGAIKTSFDAVKGRSTDLRDAFLEDVRWISDILKRCSDANIEATLRTLCYGAPGDNEGVFAFKCKNFLCMCIIELSQFVVDYDPTDTLELFDQFESELVPDIDDIAHQDGWYEYLRTVPAEERSIEDVQEWWPFIKTEEEYGEFCLFNAERLDPVTSDGTFFFRTEKHTGRIMNEVQPGDEVWFVEGGIWPFVLRPQGGDYVLMGEAYIWQHETMESGDLEWVTMV